MMALLFLQRWWKQIAGGLAVIVLLMLYRAQMADAYDRGKADCEAATAAAMAAERERMQAKVDEAATHLAQATEALAATGTKEITRVETIWRDRPARPCLDGPELQAVREARARILASPAGTSIGPMPDGSATPPRD